MVKLVRLISLSGVFLPVVALSNAVSAGSKTDEGASGSKIVPEKGLCGMSYDFNELRLAKEKAEKASAEGVDKEKNLQTIWAYTDKEEKCKKHGKGFWRSLKNGWQDSKRHHWHYCTPAQLVGRAECGVGDVDNCCAFVPVDSTTGKTQSELQKWYDDHMGSKNADAPDSAQEMSATPGIAAPADEIPAASPEEQESPASANPPAGEVAGDGVRDEAPIPDGETPGMVQDDAVGEDEQQKSSKDPPPAVKEPELPPSEPKKTDPQPPQPSKRRNTMICVAAAIVVAVCGFVGAYMCYSGSEDESAEEDDDDEGADETSGDDGEADA